MTKGFTIKCNECGIETTYTQDGNMKAKDNDDISIYSFGYTHETDWALICECGNEVRYVEDMEE